MESLKPNLKIGTGCTICIDIEVEGDVTIGSGTIIHPKARIIAEAGPIIIGENNIIEEKAVIWNKACSDAAGSTSVMIIGNFNVFEVGSRCEALKVGDSNIFEAKCFVGREVVITFGCVVGALCKLIDAETLPDQTSVYGVNNDRIVTQATQIPLLQMEALSKLLTMYQKTMKRSSTLN